MKKTKEILCILLTFLVILFSYNVKSNAVNDLTQTKGSLTITKYEKGATGKEGQNTPLKGVTFSIYKVADDETSTEIGNNTLTDEKTTQEDGTVIFSDLDLGRYLVVEKSVPENVVEKMANFLVDIPQTSDDGRKLNYDVKVYPKTNTAYGKITLTKQNESSVKLNGVTFILQKKSEDIWVNYPDDTKAVLQTNSLGEIIVENLPIGDYRFIETSLGSNNGYILDNKTAYPFNVSLNSEFSTVVEPSSITVTNQKPTLNKVITTATRDTDDTNSIKDETNSLDIGDIATYTITTDVPTTISRLATYKINDTMESGLTFSATGFEIKGVKADLSEIVLTKDVDYTLVSEEQSFEVNFTNANLVDYKTLKLTYNAILNSEADATIKGNSNTATLTYSTIVTTDYKDEANLDETTTTDPKKVTVYTGGLKIEKRATSKTGDLLDGAIFKIATSKNDANANTFIKDANGNEITLTTTSGEASYKGLSYGKYYLVEVQAPSYIEEGETKYYNLLNKPVEITVDATTFESNANIIINRKPTDLPLTGAIGGIIISLLGVVFVIVGVIIKRSF